METLHPRTSSILADRAAYNAATVASSASAKASVATNRRRSCAGCRLEGSSRTLPAARSTAASRANQPAEGARHGRTARLCGKKPDIPQLQRPRSVVQRVVQNRPALPRLACCVKAGRKRHSARKRDSAVGGPESQDAAVAGGNTHAASRVAPCSREARAAACAPGVHDSEHSPAPTARTPGPPCSARCCLQHALLLPGIASASAGVGLRAARQQCLTQAYVGISSRHRCCRPRGRPPGDAPGSCRVGGRAVVRILARQRVCHLIHHVLPHNGGSRIQQGLQARCARQRRGTCSAEHGCGRADANTGRLRACSKPGHRQLDVRVVENKYSGNRLYSRMVRTCTAAAYRSAGGCVASHAGEPLPVQ